MQLSLRQGSMYPLNTVQVCRGRGVFPGYAHRTSSCCRITILPDAAHKCLNYPRQRRRTYQRHNQYTCPPVNAMLPERSHTGVVRPFRGSRPSGTLSTRVPPRANAERSSHPVQVPTSPANLPAAQYYTLLLCTAKLARCSSTRGELPAPVTSEAPGSTQNKCCCRITILPDAAHKC